MPDPVLGVAVTFALCTTLSALAYWRRVLTWDGTVSAFAVGLVIGVFGDVSWLLLLLFFLLSSFAATRYRFALKEAMGVQEGRRGERGGRNVLANGFAPMMVAVLSFVAPGTFPKDVAGLVFVASLAVAGADTLASEIGVLSPNAYSIVTWKRVKAGANGGVSALGTGAAFAAAVYTAFFGWMFLAWLPPQFGQPSTMLPAAGLAFIPVVVGFTGCQFDSVLGATLEERGRIDKKMVNFLATSFGVVLAVVLLILAGVTFG